MLDVLNGIYMGNTLKIPCISRFLVFSPKSKIGGSPVDVFTVYFRVFWMYLQFRRCINIQYIKIHLIHRACKFRMYWQDLDVLCLYWGCIRCIRFIKFVFDVYCVCILDVLEFRLFMVIAGILTGLHWRMYWNHQCQLIQHHDKNIRKKFLLQCQYILSPEKTCIIQIQNLNTSSRSPAASGRPPVPSHGPSKV